jgi:carbonic anhydrase
MSTPEFDRTGARWLRALVLGLTLALSCGTLACKSEKAAEAESSEDEHDADEHEESKEEGRARKRKARAKDEHEEAGEGKAGHGEKADHKAGDKGAGHAAPAPPMSAAQALAQLKSGNEAFLKGSVNINHLTEERREELAKGQHPFAIILSCSDSRVPPEQVFAQGLGDLFIIRVAGNIADPATVASIEYAAAHLGSPLLVVMGHTECGAVKAAIANAEDTPSITALVKAIQPAFAKVPKESLATDTERAVRANIAQVSEDLLHQSKLLSGLVKENKLKMAQAIYELKTGRVKWLSGSSGKKEE